MEIKKIELKKLNPAEYNPRKKLQPGSREYESLCNSINEFGLVDPIIWNKRTGNIVGGHQRYYVLLDLGITETFVSIVDLDEQKEKALNVALNRITGQWDSEKLITLLSDLDSELLELSGYTSEELDTMTQALAPLDLDADSVSIENSDDEQMKKCHCPKCGFEFAI